MIFVFLNLLSIVAINLQGFPVYFLFTPPSGINSEKAMAPHSSILAWKIPWAEEPGGLQSMGSLRVGHD